MFTLGIWRNIRHNKNFLRPGPSWSRDDLGRATTASTTPRRRRSFRLAAVGGHLKISRSNTTTLRGDAVLRTALEWGCAGLPHYWPNLDEI